MANTNLRSALSRALNSENETGRTKMVGKAALAGPAAGGLKSRPVRGAMQEIGNNGVALHGRETSNKGTTRMFSLKLSIRETALVCVSSVFLVN